MAGLYDPLQYKGNFGQHLGHLEQNNEIELYDNMAAEIFGISGIPVNYFPASADPTKDPIFGEDSTKTYESKYVFTGIVDTDSIDETLLYGGFGQLNNVEFRMFIHFPTFFKQIKREPMPGDQLFLPFNSTIIYEVTYAQHAPLGKDGNIFGFKSCWVLNLRERHPSTEQYGVTDDQGNLLPNAPADALVTDGSGRVKEKYNVPKPQLAPGQLNDNNAIEDASFGPVDPNTGVRTGGVEVPLAPEIKQRWGDW